MIKRNIKKLFLFKYKSYICLTNKLIFAQKTFKMKNIITLLIGDFSKADIIPFAKQVAFLVLAIAFYSILS